MPLLPAKVKYRKMHRGNRSGVASRGNAVAFGEYGLQALERTWITNKQIEAARVAINRKIKRGGMQKEFFSIQIHVRQERLQF